MFTHWHEPDQDAVCLPLPSDSFMSKKLNTVNVFKDKDIENKHQALFAISKKASFISLKHPDFW